MIYQYESYRSLHDFIENVPAKKKPVPYSIGLRCKGYHMDTKEFSDTCFCCLFCAMGDDSIKNLLFTHWKTAQLSVWLQSAFLGNLVTLPAASRQLKNPYKNLEAFTAVSETEHIQKWAAGLIRYMCSEKSRIGLEIPVPNLTYRRDGRLDICSITDSQLLVLECKTTLEDALKDERFIEQQEKYTKEILKFHLPFTYLTLIGGREAMLLPEQHPGCLSREGNKALRFYQLVTKHRIRFLSANALWCLALGYLLHGSAFGWDRLLTGIFKDPGCIGLLSCGKVMEAPDGSISILPLPLPGETAL